MERFFIKKYITAALFVIFIVSFSILNFINSYSEIYEDVNKNVSCSKSIQETIKSAEDIINDNILGKYIFVEEYGYLQKLIGKNEENNFEVIKDKQGKLHYTFFTTGPNPVNSIVKNTYDFKNNIENEDTKFIYIMPPDKFVRGYTTLSTRIPYNYNNETADNFLRQLDFYKINNIDLRENLLEAPIPHDKLFYNTDHHWSTNTAFWETKQIVKKIQEMYDINLDENNYYMNDENYNFLEYKNSYLGSMGRKTGMSYSTVDDFTLIYPKFKTSYTLYAKTKIDEFSINGRFEDALISKYAFKDGRSYYELEADMYSSYLFGNRGIIHITNEENKNGPKILFVKDSFAVPVAAFMSTMCSDVYLIDPRYFEGNIQDYVNSVKNLDFVFVLFSPEDLTEDFFKFNNN
ncbi:hypothetical protein [Clostridium sp. BJN0001]|uniref:alginate O-acetyltransferase AlgX-related protein n=1 Tax=Clostridium sp. BJN0001 TaxID=2930219 RepID=UPI001FCF7EB9|nr:hypothetical protein [Clostridium sp. BJN0001]